MRIKNLFLGAAFLQIFFGGIAASAATLNVCASGCAFSLPSQAYAAAQAGDTIQIQSGTYNDCLHIQKNNLTVVGIGARPRLTGKVCSSKGIIVTAARDLRIQNLELFGASNSSNFAGIRHDALGFNLTLDNVYIHDNDMGLLASSSNDVINIVNSTFERNGFNNMTAGMAHNLYIGTSSSVIFTNSKSLRTKLGGHEFKTRAKKTVIDGSTIANLDAPVSSRVLDVSNGGELIVRNSVLQKGPNAGNNDLIGYAPEGYRVDGRINTVSITGTKIIADRANAVVIANFQVPSSSTSSANVLVGLPGPAGNTSYSSRSAAGYQPNPWLPTPGTASTPVGMFATTTVEGGQFWVNGTKTIRFGTGSNWVQKSATGSIACTVAFFGRDPSPGAIKKCEVLVAPTWNFKSNEGEIFSITGNQLIRFGAGSSWVSMALSGNVTCTSSFFGADPLPGTVKRCESATFPKWIYMAPSAALFTVSGTQTVRFGTGTTWVQKSATNLTASCSVDWFGQDPAPGSTKVCQMLVTSSTLSGSLPPPVLVSACGTMASEACEVFKSVNAQRRNNGLSDLKPLEACELMAQSHSNDMATNGFFSHTSPTHGTFEQRADAFAIPGSAGENIAYGYTLTGVVTGWMDSPGHRANILNSSYRSGGVGYAVDGAGRPYYTQCFSSAAAD